MADDSSSSSCESTNDNNNETLNASEENRGLNAFANDGSFMELFKKKMEEAKKQETKKDSGTTNLVGKRRGGKILKTGLVKKQKIPQKGVREQEIEEQSQENKDAWSRYMAEVKKYKEHACDDDDKTRPLVK